MPPLPKTFRFVLVLGAVDVVVTSFVTTVELTVEDASKSNCREILCRTEGEARCSTFWTIDGHGWGTSVSQTAFLIVRFGERIGAGKAAGLFEHNVDRIAVRHLFEIDRSIGSVEEFFQKNDVLFVDVQLLARATTQQRT